MDYNDINKLKTDINNNSRKDFKEFKKQNTIKNIPYHESFFEHVNTRVQPYRRTGVCAEFKNVRFANTKHNEETLRKLLDFAIEHYLQLAPLKKVNVNDFINYANSEFNAQIFSIESIELKMTMSLEREIDNTEPHYPDKPTNENLIALKNYYLEPETTKPKEEKPFEMPDKEYSAEIFNSAIEEMPHRNIEEMPHRHIEEMPDRTVEEIPMNTPVEMPNRKPQETKVRKHIPEYEIEMGME